MTDQSKSWRQQSVWAFPEMDGEVDGCPREDADPDRAQAAAAGHVMTRLINLLIMRWRLRCIRGRLQRR
jgi:hypothetical protein